MHNIHIHRLGNATEPSVAGFSIQQDEKAHFVCVCHTPHSTLTDSIYRMCTDHILEFTGAEKNTVTVFTDILEKINRGLDGIYLKHNKQEVSLFIGLVLESHLHFSMFGREITGMIVSEQSIEDIFTDMDTGEGHFVYDSHGDIKENESLCIFAPAVDTHIIGTECQRLSHLPIEERLQLIGERIERSNIHKEGIILSVTKESPMKLMDPEWNPKKIHTKREPQALLDGIKKSGSDNMKKIQTSFVNLGKNTQNWTIITGLVISIALLYIIVTTVMQSQYQIFVPQKYRELLAEGRSKLTEATRLMDQPENFSVAMNDVKEIVETVKSAGVLKVELQLLESDLANLEKSVNKVTTLKREEFRDIFTFAGTTPSVPFEMYVNDKKLFFLSQDSIIGPYIPGETPKEYKLPDGQKYEFSDIDTEGRVYIATNSDKIYMFDKGIFNTLNIQQVGGWDDAVSMSVYNSNIYLLGADRKQIYKYRKQAENSYAGRSFVISDTQSKPIIDIDIDGSVWLMNATDKLATEKILTAPRYERRPIGINNMGINTLKSAEPDVTKLYAGEAYQEVYMLADNKIWVFVPNSKRFSDVRSLTYAGQIDVPSPIIITDIAIQQDGDIREIYFGSPSSGIFATKITIKDNKIQILGK